MRVGVVILPDLEWPLLRDRWLEAERLGFATGWVYDHLSWRSLRDGPWLGAIPLLAAVADATRTMRLGTMVTSPNFRHPALLAKDVMTLDRISDGRIDLGIGAGGVGFDASVLGGESLSQSQRTDRFVEFTAAMDVLLRDPQATVEGEWFTAIESRTFPGCVQEPRVPFTVAAAGPRAMRVAAIFGDSWVTYGPIAEVSTADGWFDALADQVARLEATCREAGRDPETLRRTALIGLTVPFLQDTVAKWRSTRDRLGELGFTDVAVHWPRPGDPELPGPPQDVFADMAQQ